MEEVGYTMEELFPVVAGLAESYAGYESTSVTWERAQQLMEAVVYCIREYETSGAFGVTAGRPEAAQAYKLGYDMAVQKVHEMKSLYHQLLEDFQSYGVLCLEDTVWRGIPEFLKWYDVRYAPQNTLLTLDYPIFMDISKSSGIDAVYIYVKSICLEQRFLSAFDRKYIQRLLGCYSSGYKDMIENVCSIVLTNALGHILARKPLGDPGFMQEDYAHIRRALENCSAADIKRQLAVILKQLISAYFENKDELLEYLSLEMDNVSVRIWNALVNGHLERVFLL